MQIPAFAEDGDNGGTGVGQLADIAVLFDRVLCEASGSERGELGVFEFEITSSGEEVPVFGIGAGPSAFNVVDTKLVEFVGNEDFVLDRERDGFALRAVPERGVESLNAHGRLFTPRVPCLSAKR